MALRWPISGIQGMLPYVHLFVQDADDQNMIAKNLIENDVVPVPVGS
jgi:hypothetical protein